MLGCHKFLSELIFHFNISELNKLISLDVEIGIAGAEIKNTKGEYEAPISLKNGKHKLNTPVEIGFTL
ncbi:MAG TPA: hypothetical protein DEF48_01645 [Nostoc sp. UBA8866]|nr:hypothetical protein DSM107007_17940 [Nostoc sp. PCC 7120 = FACHB-418]HBW28800.1 hypothetical protein [Nostoc sp. UBA8866]